MKRVSVPYWQSGNGMLPAFQGVAIQKGHGGIGGVFKGLARSFAPVLKKGLVYAGKKTLKTIIPRMINDVTSGTSFKQSLKNRASEGVREVGNDIKAKLATSFDIQNNKTTKAKNKVSRKRTFVGKGGFKRSASKKRKTIDIFD